MIRKDKINLQIGAFVGLLRIRATNQPLMCEVCGKERAEWCHPMKKGDKKAYLCFGCGGH